MVHDGVAHGRLHVDVHAAPPEERRRSNRAIGGPRDSQHGRLGRREERGNAGQHERRGEALLHIHGSSREGP